MWLIPGTAVTSWSIRLGISSTDILEKPIILPPRCARLAASPLATGSGTDRKKIPRRPCGCRTTKSHNELTPPHATPPICADARVSDVDTGAKVIAAVQSAEVLDVGCGSWRYQNAAA